MSVGRVVAAITASLAVGGCAVAVVDLAAAARPDAAARISATVSAAPTSRPAFLPGPSAATTSSRAPAPARMATPVTAAPVAGTPVTGPAPGTTALPVAVPVTRPVPVARPTAAKGAAQRRTVATPRPVARPTHARVAPTPAEPTARPTTKPAPPKPTGQRLPLRYSTGTATRVITVSAGSHSSTTATLQAWTKVSGGWKKYGSSVTAHVGADGIGAASESTSRTPAGSFSLTQAFGRMSDPGTALPYFRTTPSDYWISDGGRFYNTHQRCSSCGYNDGVNERLYYETPYYNYAVVIDYNTRNAPGGVRTGRGSAFFLHVTDGRPTAGCVSIPQSRLVPLMRWLTPSAHPRILIGVS